MAAEEQVGSFTVTIDGEGLHVKQTVDAPKVGEVIAALFGAPRFQQVHSSDESLDSVLGSKSDVPRPRLALRECLEESGATRFHEKILVIGDYLMEHGDQDDFGREDVRTAFQRAREVLPKNLPRDFGSAIQNGWIAELAGKSGRFYVTNRGKEVIARKFTQESSKPSVRRRRGTGRRQGVPNHTADASE
jgi:hypothetical protein